VRVCSRVAHTLTAVIHVHMYAYLNVYIYIYVCIILLYRYICARLCVCVCVCGCGSRVRIVYIIYNMYLGLYIMVFNNDRRRSRRYLNLTFRERIGHDLLSRTVRSRGIDPLPWKSLYT
jgi:hypothetical protein